jgi:hypothetical protein
MALFLPVVGELVYTSGLLDRTVARAVWKRE